MESDFPYMVFWNLLRILNNLPCKWTFTRTTGKGEEELCQLTRQKIDEIKKLSDEFGLQVGSVLKQLWNKDLRNTFSHSQYTLSDGKYSGTRTHSPFSRKRNKTLTDSDIDLEFDYIEELVHKSTGLFGAFLDTYKHYVAPYKDGSEFQVQDGTVVWDSGLKRWVWPKRYHSGSNLKSETIN
ncbi:MAG: hypothetical protein R3A44_01410 [Caldilineaceae bacterium]